MIDKDTKIWNRIGVHGAMKCHAIVSRLEQFMNRKYNSFILLLEGIYIDWMEESISSPINVMAIPMTIGRSHMFNQ